MRRELPASRAEKKSVESCHVSGCHRFFGPELRALQKARLRKGGFLWRFSEWALIFAENPHVLRTTQPSTGQKNSADPKIGQK